MGQVYEPVGAHCQHLGLDLDQMGALLHVNTRRGVCVTDRTAVRAALAGHRERG
jgi:hypothetical protein